MNEIKEFQQNALNQSKYWYNQAKDNTSDLLNQKADIIDIQKKMIRQNPMNSLRYTWQEAQMRKSFIFWSTLPFVISETFWKTWYSVYKPEGNIESSPKEENY